MRVVRGHAIAEGGSQKLECRRRSPGPGHGRPMAVDHVIGYLAPTAQRVVVRRSGTWVVRPADVSPPGIPRVDHGGGRSIEKARSSVGDDVAAGGRPGRGRGDLGSGSDVVGQEQPFIDSAAVRTPIPQPASRVWAPPFQARADAVPLSVEMFPRPRAAAV